jgi:hypothetical protein
MSWGPAGLVSELVVVVLELVLVAMLVRSVVLWGQVQGQTSEAEPMRYTLSTIGPARG